LLSNILIRCDATEAVALGHLRRCLYLAKAISKFTNLSVVFGCYDDLAAHRLLDAEDYLKHWFSQTIGKKGDFEETIRLASDINAEWVLLDSYDVSFQYFAAMKKKGTRA